MRRGDIVHMRGFTHVILSGSAEASFRYAKQKGTRAVFLYLGEEPDAGPALDAEAALGEMGWTFAADSP